MPATIATLDHVSLVESKKPGHITIFTSVHYETGMAAPGEGVGATIHVELELPRDFKIGDLPGAVSDAMKKRVEDIASVTVIALSKPHEGWEPQ